MFYVTFITKHLFSLELEISLSIDIIVHKQNEARTPVKTNIDAPRSIYVEWLCYNDLFIVPNSVRKNPIVFVRELKLLVFIRNIPRSCIRTSIDSYEIGLLRVFLLDNIFKIVLLLYNSLLHLLLLTHLNVLALIDALKITETRKEN